MLYNYNILSSTAYCSSDPICTIASSVYKGGSLLILRPAVTAQKKLASVSYVDILHLNPIISGVLNECPQA